MNRLKDLRKKRELTQDELAERTGIKVATIQKWEQGKNDLAKASVENVYKLANVLGVSIEFLTGLSDTK